MSRSEQIKIELATAEAALREANEGKARVCARRAVALASEDWLDRYPQNDWGGDAMHHLRQIQQEESFPLTIREAAERLSTKVTDRETAPFTSDPISDARLIIDHLIPDKPD